MIQSIIIYGLLFAVMISLSAKYSRSGSSKELTNPYILVSCLFYTLIFGLRYDVGVDYLQYLFKYIEVEKYSGEIILFKEPFWNRFARILTDLNGNYIVFFSIVAFLQIAFLMKAFTFEKKFTVYFVAAFLLGGYFLMFQNTMRQGLVISVMLCVLMRNPDLSLLKWTVLATLLTLIHKSAIVILLIYPIFHFNLYLSGAFVKCIMYLFFVLIGNFVDAFSNLVNSSIFLSTVDSVDYNVYQDNFDMGMTRTIGLGYFLKIIANCILFWYSDKIFSSVDLEYSKKWLMTYYIGTLLMSLFPTSMLLSRALMYFTIWELPLFGIFIYYTAKSISIKKFVGVSYISIIIALTISTTLFKPKGMHSYYHFYWESPYVGYTFYDSNGHK